MIQHPAFTVDPWSVRETALHLDLLPQTESLFALSNGHIGLRGNLDEGEPYGLPGTYLNSVYELTSLPNAEPAYGDPESGQTVLNVTNGKFIRLLVDDEPFDVRYRILAKAKARAHQLGLCGAAFPWRTIAGEECSAYWPASMAAFHVNADVAYAVVQYVEATNDTAFEEEVGAELVIETARLWHSLGHYDMDGQFCIDGVTGPDEYSALADNNVYTNLLAQQNLRAAADAVERHPQRAHALDVDDDEVASWRQAAVSMRLPADERLGVTPQAESFTPMRGGISPRRRRTSTPCS